MSKERAWIKEQMEKARELREQMERLPWLSDERKSLQEQWLTILDNVAILRM